jgi:hypothetical protein
MDSGRAAANVLWPATCCRAVLLLCLLPLPGCHVVAVAVYLVMPFGGLQSSREELVK